MVGCRDLQSVDHVRMSERLYKRSVRRLTALFPQFGHTRSVPLGGTPDFGCSWKRDMLTSLIWRSFKFGFAVHKFKDPLGHDHLRRVAAKKLKSTGTYATVPRKSVKSNSLNPRAYPRRTLRRPWSC